MSKSETPLLDIYLKLSWSYFLESEISLVETIGFQIYVVKIVEIIVSIFLIWPNHLAKVQAFQLMVFGQMPNFL